MLEKGDGTKVFLDEAAPLLTTVIGSDQQRPVNCPFCDAPAGYFFYSFKVHKKNYFYSCITFISFMVHCKI